MDEEDAYFPAASAHRGALMRSRTSNLISSHLLLTGAFCFTPNRRECAHLTLRETCPAEVGCAGKVEQGTSSKKGANSSKKVVN